MACSNPILAWRTTAGEIVFIERGHDVIEELQLPCGHCTRCKLERSRQWAVRCKHEATLHKNNCFVTLTYDEEHCPRQLEYTHYQDFMRRLRKHYADQKIRFFMCGEYGSRLQRPHFHACLFGLDFDDKYYWRRSESGADSFRSQTLESIWTQGASEIGELTFASAAYTARYCMKKVTGWNARYWYGDKTPEFVHMSLKPGIGKGFLDKWSNDIYPHDYVVINGKESKPPKYYDRKYQEMNEASYEEIKHERLIKGRQQYKDNTPQRLMDKEIVAKARIEALKRGLHE